MFYRLKREKRTLKLKRLLKNKFQFENGLQLTLSSEIIQKYNLRKREELAQEEYEKVLELAALSTSYYYLTKRDYSKKELYYKLLEKYREKKIVNSVIKILEEKEYLDDYEFASNFVKIKNSSKKKLEFELKLKGIESWIINEVMSEYESEKEIEVLKKELEKVRGRDERKQIESLMRKGFKYSDIVKVIKEK